MCGICGKLNFDYRAGVSHALLTRMADAIRHRGPDDDGYYTSGNVGLGFRRLSIIDLKTGHQPISNEDGTAWLVFNGEIYNYRELRQELLDKGHVFRTTTDTEVIIHLYEEMGEECVKKLRGMFGFAIWDERRKTLMLARDRIGIKPLYYYLSDKCLIFASEMKAILADPEVEREILPGMIDRFLTFQYLPGAETIFKGIHKLEPGSYLTVRNNEVKVSSYWDLSFAPSSMSLRDAEARLAEMLDETMRLHMISDVPVGFLLSGGFDSTVLLSIASAQTERQLSSFTVGFSGTEVADERPYAALAAKHFGTKHHEITITSKQFESFLPQYIWHMEEPICEPPAVAMYYVSKLATESVKVLISGEGGDEAFGGYPVYRRMLWIERLKRMLGPFSEAGSRGLTSLNRVVKSRLVGQYAPLLGRPLESVYYSGLSNPFSYFNQHAGELYTPAFAQEVSKEYSLSAVQRYLDGGPKGDPINKMLYVDTKTWLGHDLLLKADKMTMANSIELRVPFLDHEILEFAASLPGNYKVRGLATKYFAKRALKRHVPPEILNRKKAGFPVPYASWLRTDMREWLRDILLDRTTLERGYFQKACVEHLIGENVRTGAYSKELFCLAVLELWHRTFLCPTAALVTAGA
jgi:asparagine synthase (glutamine-hydrolysing)